MKAALMIAVACVLGLSVTLRADTHIYSANSDGSWSKAGRILSSEQSAIVCAEGDCITIGVCSRCHVTAMDARQYTTESQRRHGAKYFP
jgi:hypothetical protein